MKLPFCSLKEKRRLEKEIELHECKARKMKTSIRFWHELAIDLMRFNASLERELDPPPTPPEEANRLISELAEWVYA